MSLLWPWLLLLMGLIPLTIAAYVWMRRRHRRFTVRYSSLTLVREARPHQSRLRRHLPFALFLLALASLIAALARPVALVSVPVGQATTILALDVSWSMCSTDIPPNRIQAAQREALAFIRNQPSNMQIGIVAFAGFAELAVAPTTDQEVLQTAVENLNTARWTAIGSAINKSLDAIAEVDGNVAALPADDTSEPEPAPLPEGAYAPAIIVLLTDGASNRGPLPVQAAEQAAERGIRIYTIGFGTETGAVMDCGRSFSGGFGGGRFGGGGGGFRRGIDEPTLQQIADMTDGEYYSAESASELQDVFQNLPTALITRTETREISVVFAALGALLAVLAVGFSLRWHPLP